MTEVRYTKKGLDELRAQLTAMPKARAHVGLFAEKSIRKAGTIDNPNLGLEHEYGDPRVKLPQRSFLRLPLIRWLGPEVELKGRSLFRMLRSKGLPGMLKLIGVLGESVVQRAFVTGGFGAWPKLANTTIKRKGSAKILIETAQLRKAVSSRVVLK